MWIVVKNIKYVEKLMELLRRLREAGVARFAVAMPFAVYKKYCRNMEELRMMRRHVYIVDVDVAARELSGRIPEGALPCLKLIASLSPSLLRELSRSPRHVTWRPAVAGGTGEGEALAWAVRMIISKGGPLTVDDVVRAGYRDYLDSLIVLGMVERG
jgi:sulfur transfer complex TusBCD TusB component (DsrH family)